MREDLSCDIFRLKLKWAIRLLKQARFAAAWYGINDYAEECVKEAVEILDVPHGKETTGGE